MFHRFFLSFLLLSVLAFNPALAGERFKSVSLNEVDSLLQKKEKVFIYDANTESTRTHVGIIPGAKLLNSSSNYDVKSELPPDKSSHLIFYCANQMCTASHDAANRAINAGYKNVGVMKDGIYGWQKAGKALAKIALPAAAASSSAAKPSVAAIEPKDADELVKKGQGVIVDVREGEERHEIIENSLWIPMSKITKDPKAWSDFTTSLPKDKVAIFHCSGGYRSNKVAEKLAGETGKALYFKGPDEWKSQGLPLVSGPAKN